MVKYQIDLLDAMDKNFIFCLYIYDISKTKKNKISQRQPETRRENFFNFFIKKQKKREFPLPKKVNYQR